MIIALGIPCYKQSIHVGTAQNWTQDTIFAMQQGWRPMMLWADTNSIETSRNLLVKQADEAGARLLLMCDSDTFPAPPTGGLKSMWDAMSETGAAVVGAAVTLRNREGVNCQPARPGEIYEGESVGTAYQLLDLVRLRAIPKPWFSVVLSDDGTEKAIGSDIGFCRLARAHGLRVVINYAIQMAHAESIATSTRF
jgi:hypothetical protein